MILAIDPGHGGRNTGTSTPDGTLVEKDLTLRVGTLLHHAFQRLARIPGHWPITSYLARMSDLDLSLPERGARSIGVCANLVYTIHANHLAGTAPADGVRCFHWPGNERAAYIARAIADAFPPGLRQKTNAVAVAEPGGQQNVLKYHACDAVLIELGFLDDAEDAAMLQDPNILDGIVAAMLVGATAAL